MIQVKEVEPWEHECLAGAVDWNLGWRSQEKGQPGSLSTAGALLKVMSCCWGFVGDESREGTGMTGTWHSVGKRQEAE